MIDSSSMRAAACAGEADEVGLPASVLERVRADTPSLSRVLHLDNAGSSPSPDPVHARIVAHLDLEREIGGYAAARAAADELEGLYSSLATLIGARREDIAFAENATRAWEMAFHGIAHGIAWRRGDRILTTRTEYGSSYLSFLRLARTRGVSIDIVPDGPDGAVDSEALRARLDDRVRLVNICHAPTSNGLLNDAQAVGEVLRDHPALYFLDACQSIGHIEVDVRRIGCDVLSATGRKFLRGPRGTGFLYVRREKLEQFEPAFIDLRSADWISRDDYAFQGDARRFETWESAMAGRLGLKAAVDYALALGIRRIEHRVRELGEALRTALSSVRGVSVLDRGSKRTGIVTFVVAGWNAVELRDELCKDGTIALGAVEVTDARLDLEPRGEAVLRAAVHYFNTDAEITRVVERIAALAQRRIHHRPSR